MIKVVKFGGSSVASAEQFKKVKNIVTSDDKRRVVVVSALGKRFSKDSKITDMLYLLSYHIKYNVDSTQIFNQIENRYEEVRSELNISIDLKREFNIIKDNIKNGASEDYIVSRGEYLCAKMMASYLGFEFVDAYDIIFFKYDGTIDNERTIDAVNSKFTENKKIVVPGFYGAYPTGDIKLFSRGGSDITGSILAMALKVDEYENWTDVSGLLMADPRIVDNPMSISEITYDELRELSYMGASVLHEETIFPVKEQNIPIHILNTNAPSDEGTIICRNSNKTNNVITGVSGKKNFTAFTVFKSMSANKLTVIRDTLNALDKFNVSVEHIPTSIDSFSVIVESKVVEKSIYDILLEIKKVKGVISVDVDKDIALVAVVGRNMALKPGISGKIFSLFGENGINIKTINQGAQEINIIVGVSNNDFEFAIKTIYRGIVLGE